MVFEPKSFFMHWFARQNKDILNLKWQKVSKLNWETFSQYKYYDLGSAEGATSKKSDFCKRRKITLFARKVVSDLSALFLSDLSAFFSEISKCFFLFPQKALQPCCFALGRAVTSRSCGPAASAQQFCASKAQHAPHSHRPCKGHSTS